MTYQPAHPPPPGVARATAKLIEGITIAQRGSDLFEVRPGLPVWPLGE